MDVLNSRLFHTMAAYIRDLVCCEDVCMLLYCHNSILCHPFLAQAISQLDFSARCYGSIRAVRLLAEERVRAMCDIAIQTGSAWRLVRPLEYKTNKQPLHILVAPLRRPGGIVGIIVCTTTAADAFGPGEGRLLSQFLPTLARLVEQALQHLCIEQPYQLEPDPVAPSPSLSLLGLDRLESKLAEQDALLSMIGHDFRTPLSVIKGYIGLLQAYGFTGEDDEITERMSPESQRRYLLSVMEQVQHLEVLVDDLLDLARMQSGQIALRPGPLDLVPLCQRVARQMQDRVALQETVQFTIQCLSDAELPAAWADEHRVRQILENLLENAIKYSPEGGLIEILVYSDRVFPLTDYLGLEDHTLINKAEAPLLCITVRDHGIGIPQWQQSMVFEPFLRLPQPTARQISGVGLGLYIVRKLVEAMDGTITLQSREDQGTSITLTLPVANTAVSITGAISTTDKVLL